MLKCNLFLFSSNSIILKVNKKFCYVLFQLSNHQFEELAMDVYDEVDRRETDAGKIYDAFCACIVISIVYVMNLLYIGFFSVWLATQNHSTLVTDTTVVPFLPVNPEYSSTRNQASDHTKLQCLNFNVCMNYCI